MSIELPKQPHDGRPRHCYKCKASFVPTGEHRNARQCPPCRANPPKPFKNYVTRPHQPAQGHTNDWDKRSLGVMEAAALRLLWGPEGSDYVTGNCDD